MCTLKFYLFVLTLVSVGFVTCSNSSSLSDNTVNPSGNGSLSSEDPDNQSVHALFTGVSAPGKVISKIPPAVDISIPTNVIHNPPTPINPPEPRHKPTPITIITNPHPGIPSEKEPRFFPPLFDQTPKEDNPNTVKRPMKEPTTEDEIEEVEKSQIVDKPPKNYKTKKSGTCKEGRIRQFACTIFIMSSGSILVVPVEAKSEPPSNTADKEKDKEADKGADQTQTADKVADQTADEVVDQSQIVDITPKGYTKERAGTCKGSNGVFKCTIYTMPTGPTLVTALKVEKLPSGAAKVEVFSVLLLVLSVALTVEM